LHSVYVDQWDWEKVILPEERTEETLKQTVLSIVDAIYYTQQVLCAKYDV
jgi:aspartate--ammonia ligase